MLESLQTPPAENQASVGVKDIFFAFNQIGLSSFGGGMSGRMMHLFVYERHWMDEESFLNGLAVSQALPGVNVSNMAIWIGYQLGGSRGALAGIMGILFLPAFFLVLLGILFSQLTQFPLTHIALSGAVAAAIGLSIFMGITAVVRLPRRIFPFFLMVVTFVAAGILHWSLIWTVLACGSAGVAMEYWRALKKPGEHK
jgi:Chromate transport protein ChrA